jgi:hypothetical protein
LDYDQELLVIHAPEEFFNIAFENINGLGVIMTDLAKVMEKIENG